MGREIRRVPADWKHPKGPDGRYLSVYDQSLESAIVEYERERREWEGEGGEAEHGCSFEDWNGEHPSAMPEFYRDRDWTEEEATHFQVYETVTEGSPVSPVLPSREVVVEWCVRQGYSRQAAQEFARTGWVPSMMSSPATGLVVGIECAAHYQDHPDQE